MVHRGTQDPHMAATLAGHSRASTHGIPTVHGKYCFNCQVKYLVFNLLCYASVFCLMGYIKIPCFNVNIFLFVFQIRISCLRDLLVFFPSRSILQLVLVTRLRLHIESVLFGSFFKLGMVYIKNSK